MGPHKHLNLYRFYKTCLWWERTKERDMLSEDELADKALEIISNYLDPQGERAVRDLGKYYKSTYKKYENSEWDSCFDDAFTFAEKFLNEHVIPEYNDSEIAKLFLKSLHTEKNKKTSYLWIKDCYSYSSGF